MRSDVEVLLLGPLELRRSDVPVALPRGRARALLALLALSAGRPLSTDRIVDELWGPSPPATVATALHGLVSGLRKRLEPSGAGDPQLLLTRAPGYVLAIEPEQVDAHRFRDLVRRATAAPLEDRARRLRDALALWRGSFLDGLDLTPDSTGGIELEELRLAAREEIFDAELRLGRHREAVGEIEALAAAHPFRERLHGQLMLARYRCGQQAKALEAWHRARTILVEQVGVEPGPGLCTLHQAILEHDPALDLSQAPRQGGPDLTARAGELLAAAGSRVYERHYDAETAAELFSRAESLLPPSHPLRDEVAAQIPEAYVMLGRHGDADAWLKRALVQARSRGDARAESHVRLERARLQLFLGPDPVPLEAIESVATEVLADCEERQDEVHLAQALFVLGTVALRRGQIARMEELARREVEAADRSGHPREVLAARWWLALALVEGRTPPAIALPECERLADMHGVLHGGVLTEVARLCSRLGAHDRARESIVAAEQFLQQRPAMVRPSMFVAMRRGQIALMADHHEEAETAWRRALALADDLAEEDQRAQLAARLGRVLAERGQMDEATELAGRSRRTAPAESVTAQALWQSAAAAVADARGDDRAARGHLADAIAAVPGEMVALREELETQLGRLSHAVSVRT